MAVLVSVNNGNFTNSTTFATVISSISAQKSSSISTVWLGKDPIYNYPLVGTNQLLSGILVNIDYVVPNAIGNLTLETTVVSASAVISTASYNYPLSSLNQYSGRNVFDSISSSQNQVFLVFDTPLSATSNHSYYYGLKTDYPYQVSVLGDPVGTIVIDGYGDNGATNSNTLFWDSSLSALSVIDVGAPLQGTFNPYITAGQGVYNKTQHAGSVYFKGSNKTYLSTYQAVPFGAGDWTIEFWTYTIFLTGFTAIDFRPSGTNGLYPTLTYNQGYRYFTNSADQITTTYLPVSTWNHIALSKNSGNTRLFINGILSGTYVDSNTYVANRAIIGADGNAINTNMLTGFMSDVRIVNGQGIYTTNFTPPTAALTLSGYGGINQNITPSSVSLSIKNNAAINDASCNISYLTIASGTPTAGTVVPLLSGKNVLYNKREYSSSVYFDGTSDYITTKIKPLNNTDFTIDFWVNMLQIPVAEGIFQYANGILGSITTNTIALNFQPTFIEWYVGNIGPQLAITPSLNTWYHFAICKTNSVTTLYMNGVSALSAVDTLSYTGTDLVLGGSYTSTYLANQYLSDFRVISGQALYTQPTLTVPNAPLTLSGYGSTSQGITGIPLFLLDAATETCIKDSIGSVNLAVKSGKPRLSTIVPKNGITSILLNGSSNLTWNPSINTYYSLSAFTAEMWYYPLGSPASAQLYSHTSSGWNYFLITSESGVIKFYGAQSGAGVGIGTGTVTIGRWNHIAVVRESTLTNMLSVFIDGRVTGVGTCAVDFNDNVSNIPIIGSAWNNSAYLSGYISNFRITKNKALYTGPFNPSPTWHDKNNYYISTVTGPLTAGDTVHILGTTKTNGTSSITVDLDTTNFYDVNVHKGGTLNLSSFTGTYKGYTIYPQTRVLIEGDGATITDSCSVNNTMTVTNTVISNIYKKFSNGAIVLTAANSNVSWSGATADFSYGTGAFTIDFWIYPIIFPSPTVGVQGNMIYAQTKGGVQGLQIALSSSGHIYHNWDPSFTDHGVISYLPLQLTAWNHVVLSRTSTATNSLSIYINGVHCLSTTNSMNYTTDATRPPRLGNTTGSALCAFIDQFRINNGLVVFTSAFNPNAEALNPLKILGGGTLSANILSSDNLTMNIPIEIYDGGTLSASGYNKTWNSKFTRYHNINTPLLSTTNSTLNWSIGDQLIITPNLTSTNSYELATVLSAGMFGSNSILSATNLLSSHDVTPYIVPNVINLSRSLKFGNNGNIQVIDNGRINITNAEFNTYGAIISAGNFAGIALGTNNTGYALISACTFYNLPSNKTPFKVLGSRNQYNNLSVINTVFYANSGTMFTKNSLLSANNLYYINNIFVATSGSDINVRGLSSGNYYYFDNNLSIAPSSFGVMLSSNFLSSGRIGAIVYAASGYGCFIDQKYPIGLNVGAINCPNDGVFISASALTSEISCFNTFVASNSGMGLNFRTNGNTLGTVKFFNLTAFDNRTYGINATNVTGIVSVSGNKPNYPVRSFSSRMGF